MTFEHVRFPDVSTRDPEYVKADCLTTHSMASCGFIGLNMLNITGSQSGCFVWLNKSPAKRMITYNEQHFTYKI
jgi:hypothetical protein